MKSWGDEIREEDDLDFIPVVRRMVPPPIVLKVRRRRRAIRYFTLAEAFASSAGWLARVRVADALGFRSKKTVEESLKAFHASMPHVMAEVLIPNLTAQENLAIHATTAAATKHLSTDGALVVGMLIPSLIKLARRWSKADKKKEVRK